MRLLLSMIAVNLLGTMATEPCICNPGTAWLDVMLLFDSSAATTDFGLQTGLFSHAQFLFGFVNVQNASCTDPFHTRIGIIVYAANVTLLYPLGSLNQEQFQDIDTIPFLNEQEANLKKAILMSMNEFQGPAHRPNARRVIFIFATAYNPYGVNSPWQTAELFKESNGIIIIYNYVQTDSLPVTEMEAIASPGYFLSNYLDPYMNLTRKALCDANCYCKSGRRGFQLDPSSFVPIDVLSPRTNFWTGLQWNSTINNCVWSDGSPFSPDGYSPFYGNRIDGLNCVYTYKEDLTWRFADCRNGYNYVCEEMACDSMHYCTDIV